VGDIAIGKIGGIGRRVEGVAGGVAANESETCSMEVSRARLPAADIGGFLSVPDVVRSPVVKKKTAW